MSEAIMGALIGAIAALAGTALTSLLESRRQAREREYARREALRAQRAQDYRAFVESVIHTTQELAKAARTEAGSSEREAASRLVNARITGGTLHLELIAEPETLRLARELRTAINKYRTIVEDGGSSDDPAWAAISRDHYLPAREAFQKAARAEVIGIAS